MAEELLPCKGCGVLLGVEEFDNKMWEVYNRLKSGKQHYEPLVFTSDYLQENVQDEDDHEAVMGAMGRDMANRGLCTECGRPDLKGVTEDDLYTEEEASDLADMYAEMAAERRMGA